MLIRQALEQASQQLAAAGIQTPDVDAAELLSDLINCSRGELELKVALSGEISEEQFAEFSNCIKRRANREPLQHITGYAYFRKLRLRVGPGVFVPRPETEFVTQLAIDALLQDSSDSPIAIDLASGSGAIAISLATEVSRARVYAVEISDRAFNYALENQSLNSADNLEIRLGDLSDAFPELEGLASVVISNPPYIPEDAVPRDPEVRLFDPPLALYGGADGLDIIRVVSRRAKKLLREGGTLVIEHADSQGEQVRQLLLAERWRDVRLHQDLTGRDRAVTANL